MSETRTTITIETENERDLKCFVHSRDMAISLWEITHNLKKSMERDSDYDDKTLDAVFIEIHNILEENGVNIEDLTY